MRLVHPVAFAGVGALVATVSGPALSADGKLAGFGNVPFGTTYEEAKKAKGIDVREDVCNTTTCQLVYRTMVSDLPVITSSLNGASEIITPRKNGTVIADPRDTDAVVEAIRFWILQRGQAEMPPKHELSLERNVEETLAVLELAAREKRR